MIRRIRPAAAALAGVVLLSGCTTAVTGSASPVPGQGPVITKADPCALITQEHAAALGVVHPGDGREAQKERKIPATCRFSEVEDAPNGVPLNVSLSIDLSLQEYMMGALAGEKFGIGGFTWTRYATILGPSNCSLSAELSPTSFVEISSDAPLDADESRACDLARAAAPAVASQLPGGQPNPQVTAPPGQKPPEPSGPLLNLDPCTLLKPEQAGELKLQNARPMESTGRASGGCQWDDTDGDAGQKALDLWLYPASAVADVPGLEGDPEELDANGRKWQVFHENDSKVCAGAIAITETSAVYVTSGNLDDPAKACDLIKTAIPMITGQLPA